MKIMRIIGDVHGHYQSYLNIVKECEYSVQLGDFGFDYSILNSIDSQYHKVLAGNHDNYDKVGNFPHFLGDFGITTLNNIRFGYIRGALSVDRMYRIPSVSWWENEELEYDDGNKCVEFFRNNPVDIMLSHDCPHSIVPFVITNPYKVLSSTTNRLLEFILYDVRPIQWFFGHHHHTWSSTIDGCYFRCLNELEFVDL